MDRNQFEERLLTFIRKLCVENGIAADIGRDTALFENRLINSMRIIDLMGFIESELSIEVPEDKLTMNFFRTPRIIADTFCPAGGEAKA
jgi:acyl carrier protein